MSHKHDVLDQLAKVPLFHDCSRKQLAQIASLATPLMVEEGVEFITEGSFAREMVIIATGSAEVRKQGVKVAEIGPGAVVGELALLTGHPRNATVMATSKSELLVLDSAAFATLLDDVPSVTRAILTTVARRLTEAEKPH